MRILLLHTYYPEFLDELYERDPTIVEMDFDRQLHRIFQEAFSVGDAYSAGLRAQGCDARELIVNADIAQTRWAREHNLPIDHDHHQRRRQIIAAQVDQVRPDVVFVFEWCPLGDTFLTELRRKVRLLVGQISSPLPANRTFAPYDLMVSSWPPIVEHFRKTGLDAQPLKLAFDQRVLERLPQRPPDCDVTFVGGFGPTHTDRLAWMERILADIDIDIDIDVFGYGLDRIPTGSPIHNRFHGPAWGHKMYEILQRSRITLNLHARIDVRGNADTNVAANMRLYEATGVGTCLVTDRKDNLAEMFEPGREVVTFDSNDDCVEKLRYLLDRENERAAVAQAGQTRTLRDHTYPSRMAELFDLLRNRI